VAFWLIVRCIYLLIFFLSLFGRDAIHTENLSHIIARMMLYNIWLARDDARETKILVDPKMVMMRTTMNECYNSQNLLLQNH
jgi:hypothetical protein